MKNGGVEDLLNEVENAKLAGMFFHVVLFKGRTQPSVVTRKALKGGRVSSSFSFSNLNPVKIYLVISKFCNKRKVVTVAKRKRR